MKRGAFGTQLGFYFAAIGSAFGLGSLWRFPFIVADNGGGAFVLLYLFLVMVVGLPLLVGELMLGKVLRRSSVSAFRQLELRSQPERFLRWTGPASILCSALILAYYVVISGWVLHFVIQFMSSPFLGDPVSLSMAMSTLHDNGWLQLVLTSMHLSIGMVIVAKGVEDGLERWVGYVIPIFIAVVFLLMLRAMQLESAEEGLRFFLYPDFAKLKWESLGAAVGQLCFTLSIGLGTMVTFGSYLRDESKVPSTGFRVSFLDSSAGVIGGILLFPLIVGTVLNSDVIGPELLFHAVPNFLIGFDGGLLFGFFFFMCLYLASLGATVSIMETIVANLQDRFHIKREKACLLVAGVVFLVALIPALSTSYLSNIEIGDRGLIELMDFVLIQWVVPILALITSQLVVYKLSHRLQYGEFDGDRPETTSVLFSHWVLMMKYVAPTIIILGLVLQVVGLF